LRNSLGWKRMPKSSQRRARSHRWPIKRHEQQREIMPR
jgi:hypothetical protein